MIKANKIYNELSIYTENKIVLWGAGYLGKRYLEKLQWFEIEVVAFCDNNSAIHGTKINGVPVISPIELQEMLKENNDVVVQIACDTDEEILVEQLQDLGVINFISQKDMDHNFSYFKKYSDIDFDAKFPGNLDGNHIRLTKIDSEFTIFKENKVVIWGERFSREMLKLFNYHELEVTAFCDNNSELYGTFINGVPVVSPDDLTKMVQNGDSIVVQIADYSEPYEQLKNIGVKDWVGYAETWNILNYIKRQNFYTYNHKTIKESIIHSYKVSKKLTELEHYMIFNTVESALLICMVGKTGDYTLVNTFNKNRISAFNTWHVIDTIDKDILDNGVCNNVKIITAIREPMSHTMSAFYQSIAIIGIVINSVNDFTNRLYPFEKTSFLKNGGDVQYMFDSEANYIVDNKKHIKIESFINDFCDKVVDIKKVPFDKEKGYTIVKEGNIEVFVYQLEKMNDIAKEMAEFVGGDFTEWEMGNAASDKWIADSYKQAQKEIKISQEYFDKCFSESYVNHFYSESDIEKFKDRWRLNIRKDN